MTDTDKQIFHSFPVEIKALRGEVERLRAELARVKPSWDDAPSYAKWLGMDADGTWAFLDSKPTPVVSGDIDYGEGEPGWGTRGKQCIYEFSNWRETLEPRPKEQS